MTDALLNETLPTGVVLQGADSFIEGFEEAWQSQGGADIEQFLPASDHSLYLFVLVELIRVDLEYNRKRGKPVALATYRERFPEAFEDEEALRGMAYEEYRLRRLAGETVTPEDYESQFNITVKDWELIDAVDTAKVLERSISTKVEDGPYLAELRQEQPEVLRQWATAINTVPVAGTTFHGFHLLKELGKGAFGRVFLARQGDLANRYVVVKVATDLYQESQTLAQLQHGNVVPIISVHKHGALQAVCMPYFGATTLGYVMQTLRRRSVMPSQGAELRDLLRRTGAETPGGREGWEHLDACSFVDAVLWLMRSLADGLAHAHALGILHCDLKPENVLLADDGRPMLLDFNLARDTKLRHHRAAMGIGGTLPFMAPEHLESLLHKTGNVDERCDIYGLGVIFYEMLTGRPPFLPVTGLPRDVITKMIGDRRGTIPETSHWNSAITPAMDGILRRCLAADPKKRYQSAKELREDLDRQLSDRPLKYAPEPSRRERFGKWVRRHPRLSSSTTVAVVASLIVAVLVVASLAGRETLRRLEAQQLYRDHLLAFEEVRVKLDDRHLPKDQLTQVIAMCQQALGRYALTLDGATPDWQQAVAVSYLEPSEKDKLHEDVGELYYLLAKAGTLQAEQAMQPAERDAALKRALNWNQLAESYSGDRLPRALREQQADLLKLSKQFEAEKQVRNIASRTPAVTARDHYLNGYWNIKKGQYSDALPGLRAATRQNPTVFSPWFSLGNVHLELGQPELAVACFTACISLRPESPQAWFNRGLAYSQMNFWNLAASDFDDALQRRPDFGEALFQRANVRMAMEQWAKAEADLTAALTCECHPTRVYYLRSVVRERLNNLEGSKRDRAEALRREPTDELSWIARSEMREETDAQGALADVDEALKLNPLSMLGMQQKAHLLDERLRRPDDALAVLDRAVELYPDHVPTRAGRGVNLARRGRRAEALRDAEEALRRDSKAPNLYQVAGIFALTSRQEKADRLRAFELLWKALKSGFGLDLVDIDGDLDPIRKEPEFQRIVSDAKNLHLRKPN